MLNGQEMENKTTHERAQCSQAQMQMRVKQGQHFCFSTAHSDTHSLCIWHGCGLDKARIDKEGGNGKQKHKQPDKSASQYA